VRYGVGAATLLLSLVSVHNAGAMPTRWDCKAPPNRFASLSTGTVSGTDFSITGVLVENDMHQMGDEWAPSASVILTNAKKLTAFRLAQDNLGTHLKLDAILDTNPKGEIQSNYLGVADPHQNVSFKLSLSSSGKVSLDINGHKYSKEFESFDGAKLSVTCSGGSFSFSDLVFSPDSNMPNATPP